eukprot:scaffold10139_cov74-Cyclotella_meneghiniana.AAC.3
MASRFPPTSSHATPHQTHTHTRLTQPQKKKQRTLASRKPPPGRRSNLTQPHPIINATTTPDNHSSRETELK